MINYAYHLIFI